MRFKLAIILVICSAVFVVNGKFNVEKAMEFGGKLMGAVSSLRSKVMPPKGPQAPPPMAQPYQQIPGAHQQMAQQQYPEMTQQHMFPQHQQMQQQQYPEMTQQHTFPQHQQMQQQIYPPQMMESAPVQNYPVQRAYNPKEYYKELYDNEYQDRLQKFINRLTRIPNFLMTRKERRLLEKMKHKLCHEEKEDFEDLIGIDFEEKLQDNEIDELEKLPKGYKLSPLFND